MQKFTTEHHDIFIYKKALYNMFNHEFIDICIYICENTLESFPLNSH